MNILHYLVCLMSFFSWLRGDYYSQYQQDKYLNEHLFKNKKNGTFVDIGAHDGISLNNTYFFEKECGWQGICFEPMNGIFQKLQNIRSCICIQGCVAPQQGEVDFIEIASHPSLTEMLSGMVTTYDPRHKMRLVYETQALGIPYQIVKKKAYTLNDVLEEHKLYTIDYISLDTEGGELDILKSIDFNRFTIRVISVENNFGTKDIQYFLAQQGFILIQRLGCDEIYLSTQHHP
jgi:FkbM family methyltransferase